VALPLLLGWQPAQLAMLLHGTLQEVPNCVVQALYAAAVSFGLL